MNVSVYNFCLLRIFGLKWARFRTKKTIWRREINFSHVYLALCKDVIITTVVNYSYTGRFNIAFYKFEDMFYDHKYVKKQIDIESETSLILFTDL